MLISSAKRHRLESIKDGIVKFEIFVRFAVILACLVVDQTHPQRILFSRQDAKTQSDGPRPVIPSECEGSKKDFSLRSK